MALIGAAIGHVCLAELFDHELPHGVSRYVAIHGTHEDSPGEPGPNLEYFARPTVAVATGTKIEPLTGALEVNEAAPILALKLMPNTGALIVRA